MLLFKQLILKLSVKILNKLKYFYTVIPFLVPWTNHGQSIFYKERTKQRV